MKIWILQITTTIAFILLCTTQLTFGQQWDGGSTSSDNIFRSGYLGINNSNPDMPLCIGGNPNKGIKITATGRSTQVLLHVAGNDYGFLQLDSRTKLRGGGEPSTFEGNLGIGYGTDWNQDYKLWVKGTTNLEGDLLLDNKYSIESIYDAHDSQHYLKFSGLNNSGKGMYFTENGQLIIGTIDPCGRRAQGYALNIEGTARIDSAYSDFPNFTIVSDMRLKKNIEFLPNNSLKKFNLVKLYEYEYKADKKGRRMGIMAQEMKEILPSSVGTFKGEDGEEYYNFNPSDLHFLHMKATQELSDKVVEQRAEIEDLKNENETLQERLNNMENQMNNIYQLLAQQNQTTQSNNTVINRLEENNIVLGQNIPNPSKDETVIPFVVSENANNVLLTITDISGNIVLEQKVQNIEIGNFKLNTSSLAKGVYVYFLTVDGKASDSQKMIVQ